jgi:Xaa-Pro dipeptidase
MQNALLHRKNLLQLFPSDEKAIIYLEGSRILFKDETDFEYEFRQESNFYYLTGITEPDFSVLIELPSGKLHVVFPRRSKFDIIFRGLNENKKGFAKKFGADSWCESKDLPNLVKHIRAQKIYALKKTQTLKLFSRGMKVDIKLLTQRIHGLRRIKDSEEISCIQKANAVSSQAHEKVMRFTKPGMFEYELRAVFESETIAAGLLKQAYNGIYASGKNASVLHYVNNNVRIHKNDFILVDAGAEYEGYASDITRTFPASGKFSKKQSGLYEVVLNTQKRMIQKAVPGASIRLLHLEANRMIVTGLKELGYLKGSVDDVEENNLGSLFFPHGLGHLLGLDTHDVGGAQPKQSKRSDNLRFGDVLEPGMVLTIEPGLYFIEALLVPAMKHRKLARFMNIPRIQGSLGFGGIRIEDNIFVTEKGNVNLTKAVKERSDIEKMMQ